jgi:hypothetical protein
MKIMIKLLLLALVGAVVAPMLMKGPDGKPLLSWEDFFSVPEETKMLPDAEPSSPAGLTTVYKWKDKDGVWHFSDKPHDHETNEKLTYNPNANIIQSLAKKEEEPEAEVKAVPIEPEPTSPGLTTVPLDQVPELMDQAKQYQDMVDQRNKMMEQFNSTKK